MKQVWLSITILLLAGAGACHRKSIGHAAGDKPFEWTIRYHRGPCFGQCPVFMLYLAADGNALLDAKANLLSPGWYSAKVAQADVHDLTALIKPPAFWTQATDTFPEIADLPVMHLVFKDGRTIRDMQARGRLTGSMSEAFLMLDNMMAHADWQGTAGRPVPWQAETDAIIVQLKPGVRIEVWLSEQLPLGLRLERIVSKRTGHYLLQLTNPEVPPNDVLQHVRMDPGVVGAQWDHPVHPRQ